MKKIFKGMLALLAVVVLAACSNINPGYADKVNSAAEGEEWLTHEQVLKDLGDEAVDLTDKFSHTGIVYAVKGCKTWDEIETKINADETVEGLVIVFVAGKAVSATFETIEGNEK